MVLPPLTCLEDLAFLAFLSPSWPSICLAKQTEPLKSCKILHLPDYRSCPSLLPFAPSFLSITCYNFVPWSLLKMMAPNSDLLITSLSLDVFLFCTYCSNCQTLIHLSILLLNALLSSLTNTVYRTTQNAFGIRAKLIAILFIYLFLNRSPFYIFALLKRLFKPKAYWVALDQEIYGNTVCLKGRGNGNVSAVWHLFL